MPPTTFKLGDIVQYINKVWSRLSPNPPAFHAIGKVIGIQSPDPGRESKTGRRLTVRWGRDSADNENISTVPERHVMLLVEGDEEEEKHVLYRDMIAELVERIGTDLFRELAAPYLKTRTKKTKTAKKTPKTDGNVLMELRDDSD